MVLLVNFHRFVIRLSSRRGQSYVEILILLMLLAVALIPIVRSATQAVSSQTVAREQAQATKLSQEQIERVRAFRDRQGFAAVSCASSCALNFSLTPIPTIANGQFTTWYSVTSPGSCPTPLPTLGRPNPKQVTVVTEWSGSLATPHRSQLSTCLTDWR